MVLLAVEEELERRHRAHALRLRRLLVGVDVHFGEDGLGSMGGSMGGKSMGGFEALKSSKLESFEVIGSHSQRVLRRVGVNRGYSGVNGSRCEWLGAVEVWRQSTAPTIHLALVLLGESAERWGDHLTRAARL